MTNTHHTIYEICSGPNRTCRAAHRAGMPVHIIPRDPAPGDDVRSTLILPTYHYANVQDAIVAADNAFTNAPVVRNDDDLYVFRMMKVAHWLPVGWVDPSRRHSR